MEQILWAILITFVELVTRKKPKLDHQRMNVEDPDVYMSRFNQETWDGFVMARKPTQVVANIHEGNDNCKCLEIEFDNVV